MAEEFKVGDIVKLVMTIEAIQKIEPNPPTALCSWSVGDKRQQGWFVLADLAKAGGRGIPPVADRDRPRRPVRKVLLAALEESDDAD